MNTSTCGIEGAMGLRRHPFTPLRTIALLLAMVPLALLAGCTMQEFPQSALHPHSEYARWIQSLNVQLVFWVVIIFVLVQTMLIVAMVKFRSRPDMPDPKPVHGNTVLEIAWTIAPALILAIVAVPTVLTIFKTGGAPPNAAQALQVKAIGHQWWWEFQYPQLGITTADEVHVPIGRTVIVDIETADVIHSFWLPAVGGKRDAIPTHTNRIWFTADSVGTFPGQCAEFCGLSHANMRMKLMVESPDAFQAWAANEKRPPVDPGSATPDSTAAVAASATPAHPPSPAAQGKEIFSQSACIGCHTIEGVSVGVIGPNLTHFAARTSFAGAIFERNDDNLGKWLADPPSRKPGSLMPNLGLTPDQISALVAYLQSLK